jgi:PAS domain S-box-containing protein
MFLGLALLEALSIALFAVILIRVERNDLQNRTKVRLAHQAVSLAAQAREALSQQRPDWLGASVRMMGVGPSVAYARITTPSGAVLFVGGNRPNLGPLDPAESAQIGPAANLTDSRVFSFGNGRWEAIAPIRVGSDLRGFAWVETDPAYGAEQLSGTLHTTLIFGIIWILASLLLVWLMSLTIYRPLAILHRGTRALMTLPENAASFPLPVSVKNEFGDLIQAFNRMVASIEEQRAGLNDTLSLLDSMLANAPQGFAFFDRYARFVRINENFAGLTGIPLSRHLGRTPRELLPAGLAAQFDVALERVFTSSDHFADLEFRGLNPQSNRPFTWLVSAYPVRTNPEQIRWVGVIVRDVSERALAEEALRKTEKLAATGRLANSLAHEINNPLEGLTNLLFLLRNFSNLTHPAIDYVTMAEHEARRISEIAQQTLRFYRQSTLPGRARMAELLDSVLDLYRSRLMTLSIHVDRGYDPDMDLFCFEGEIRQVFANLVANAIDATVAGGRLIVRARRSVHWPNPASKGVRFTIADTGSGMDARTRKRIFEAFFTTKEATGTGLGLWVSHEIILRHNGTVRVRSRAAAPGVSSGTVFQVFLPDDESLLPPARPSILEQPLEHPIQGHSIQEHPIQ